MKAYVGAFATVAAVYLAWYLTNLSSQPELRFQLSSPIPVELGAGEPPKMVQQIEIVNVGRAPAHPVRVKLKSAPSKLDVIKDSEADRFAQFPTKAGGAEVVYENLAPNGRLKIVTAGSACHRSSENVEI